LCSFWLLNAVHCFSRRPFFFRVPAMYHLRNSENMTAISFDASHCPGSSTTFGPPCPVRNVTAFSLSGTKNSSSLYRTRPYFSSIVEDRECLVPFHGGAPPPSNMSSDAKERLSWGITLQSFFTFALKSRDEQGKRVFETSC